MPTLFEHPLSPYAQKNKIALREKNVPFELKLPLGIGSGAGYAADFTSASPRGEVPALIDGDVRIFDSTIIGEYIEDKWPAPPLLPRDPAARARARMIEDAMDTHYEAINWGLGEIRFMGRAKGELAAKIEAKAAQQVGAWHRWLEKQLGGAEWFGGASFGWADLSVIPYINGSAGFGLTPPAGSKLAAWAARANARPSVAKTAQEAAASISGMGSVSELIEKGLFKREYRDHRLEWMIKSGGLQVVLDGIAKDNIRFSPEFE
jgi:glutathione S-transferase/RNA polymerase-associated protein